jgi:pimeloyl-[acyl-carrier protein] synthase
MNTNLAQYFEPQITTPAFVYNPYPLLHELRAKAPVYWSEAIGAWLITRYDDIVVTMKDTSHFSNENRLGQATAYLPTEKRIKFKPFEDHYKTKGLLHSDPPDHTRLRSLVTKEFTPKLVMEMKPQIQQTVDRLLDAAEAKGGMDVVPELAAALPVSVIAEILGVPVSDRHYIKKWTDAILGFQGVNKPSEEDLSRAQECLIELRAYLMEMVKERRQRPRQDLLGKFVAFEAAGERLSEAELLNTCVTLFTAGHETTLSFISNTIYTLLSHPEQFQLLKEDPALLTPALEESLRFESPVSRQARLMKTDAELGGQVIKQGQVVMQMLNSANRDPKYFDEPDKFDIRRQNNRHMAFGQGIHFCVGATLARTEATIAISTVIRRFPNLKLRDAKPDWDTSKRNSRVMLSLHVSI